MPTLVIRCPKCSKTPRYPLPSLKRFARDSEGKAIIEGNEPIMEMAYRCRGCGEVFYHSNTKSAILPKASKELLKDVLGMLEKRKKEEQNA